MHQKQGKLSAELSQHPVTAFNIILYVVQFPSL